MFLKYFKFKKLPFTSPASRNIYYFKIFDLVVWKAKHLSLRSKTNAGRNNSGKIVARTKTSLLSRIKQIKINYNFRYLKPSFISHFHFLPFKNRLASLVHFANGAMTYYLTTENHRLFLFFHLTKIRKLRIFYPIVSFTMLFKMMNTTLISLVEAIPGRGAQYCRSSGVVGRVIKFDFKKHSTLVRLPSGVKKFFDGYSLAAFGRVSFKQNRNFLNSKAGYWRKFGCKSIVRGVAKNPVDHPHGGRTKSIRYPKTPWGKTTKFK